MTANKRAFGTEWSFFFFVGVELSGRSLVVLPCVIFCCCCLFSEFGIGVFFVVDLVSCREVEWP
ncbi:hypothetical protein DL95DRAFT_381871, partial [Leptodontidium sp. 2 PMI_412]